MVELYKPVGPSISDGHTKINGHYADKMTLYHKFGKKEIQFLVRYQQLKSAAFAHFWC